jgi:hypothetical protein
MFLAGIVIAVGGVALFALSEPVSTLIVGSGLSVPLISWMTCFFGGFMAIVMGVGLALASLVVKKF